MIKPRFRKPGNRPSFPCLFIRKIQDAKRAAAQHDVSYSQILESYWKNVLQVFWLTPVQAPSHFKETVAKVVPDPL